MHVRSLDVTEAVESNLIKVARIKLHATLLTLNHGVWSMADSTAAAAHPAARRGERDRIFIDGSEMSE